MNAQASWYKSWFDTEYYHLLYQHRDDNEARDFMNNLLDYLRPLAGSFVLDLACGRGRHARFLSDKGFRVTGLDLSENNIDFARSFERNNLHFVQGDMRDDLGTENYHLIFNLFTSFGYFETSEESQQALINMARALKPRGRLILDFMNIEKVKLGLVEEEEVTEEGIRFYVRRFIRDGFIIKEIKVRDKDVEERYEEKVQMLDLRAFERLFTKAGMKITATFGDFGLGPFEPRHSERLIMIAETL